MCTTQKSYHILTGKEPGGRAGQAIARVSMRTILVTSITTVHIMVQMVLKMYAF